MFFWGERNKSDTPGSAISSYFFVVINQQNGFMFTKNDRMEKVRE